jgi:tRNA pseudouridine55 synthase
MRFPFTGVIPVDKPAGATSRQVVDTVARRLAMKTVGHAGTLDPLAAGVVVVCVGHATKLVDYLHQLPKEYAVTFLLGRSSPSDDLETPVEEESDPRRPSREEIEGVLGQFRGAILQRPCDYSAVHVGGQRAYRLARKGREVVLPEKRVRIDRIVITGYDWPSLALDVECSTGTFIRAIGRDLAAALGTTAVMERLVRTAVGPFTRGGSIPLDAISGGGADPAAALLPTLLPALAAVPHLPRVTLPADLLELAIRGGLIDLPPVEGPPSPALTSMTGPNAAPATTPLATDLPAGEPPAVAACDPAGELVGILRPHASGRWRLRPNFQGLG